MEENKFIGPLLPLGEKPSVKEETSIPILELGHPDTEEDPGILSDQNREVVTDGELVNEEIDFDQFGDSFFGNDIDFGEEGSGQSQIEVEDFKTFLDEPFPRQDFDQFVDFKDF